MVEFRSRDVCFVLGVTVLVRGVLRSRWFSSGVNRTFVARWGQPAGGDFCSPGGPGVGLNRGRGPWDETDGEEDV